MAKETKTLDLKSLRGGVTLYVSVAMFFLIVVTALSISYLQSEEKSQREKEYSRQIHNGVDHVIEHSFKDYSYRIRSLIETRAFVEALKNGDRASLYSFLKPKWDLMVEAEPHLKIMQIHLPNGTSFLRMHRPDTYGDNLLIRPMIRDVHTRHRAIQCQPRG